MKNIKAIRVFVLINIWYFEGICCDIFYNGVQAIMQSNQAENSAGATLGNFLSKISFVLNHIHLLQFVLVIVTASIWIALVSKCKIINRICEKLLTGRVAYVLSYLWVYGLVFVSYNEFESFYNNYGIAGLNLGSINRIVPLMITIIVCAFIYRGSADDIKNYWSRKNAWLFIIVIFLIDFAACGEYLFLAKTDTAWYFSLTNISVFLLFAVWLYPILLLLLSWLKTTSKKQRKATTIHYKNSLILLSIMVLGFGVYFYAVYPGIITADGIVAWTQIINDNLLTREFPAFIKIIWSVCYKVCANVALVTLLQIVLWIWLVMAFLRHYLRKGMPMRMAVIIAFVLSWVPPCAMFILTQESNVYYTIAILWVVYYLIRTYDCDSNGNNFKIQSLIGFACALTGVFVFRNEGKVTYAIILMILMISGIVRRKKNRIAVGIISVGMVLLIQGPLFSIMNIPKEIDKSDNSINLLVNDVTLATAYFYGRFSDQSIRILEKYASVQELANMYNDHEYDCDADGQIAGLVANSEEVYPVAFDSIVHNIPIAFRERLNKSEVVWNIVAVPDVKMQHLSRGVFQNELGIVGKTGGLNTLLTQWLYFPTFMIPVWDVVIYRSGIYLCMLLVMCFYWWVNGKKRRLLVITPILAHTAVLLLSLLWPCSRHTWCIILMTWAIIIDQIYSGLGDEHENLDHSTGL